MSADETMHTAHAGALGDPEVIDLTTPHHRLVETYHPGGSLDEHAALVVEEQAVPVPMQVREAQLWSAHWLLPRTALQGLLAGTGLVAGAAGPRRGRLTISFTRVLDSDLGRYNELRVSVLVRRHDASEPGGPTAHLQPFADVNGELLLDVAVDSAQSLFAGRSVWGAPERRARVEIVHEGNRTSCLLVGADGPELTLTVAEGGFLPPVAHALPTYTWLDGTLRLSSARIDESRGARRPGGAVLVLSRSTGLAALLRRLGLPCRAALTATTTHLATTLEAPCIVGTPAEVGPRRTRRFR